LLRGAGRDTNLAAVDLARLKVEASKMLTLVKAMNLVAEVAARYTDVVAAEENLQVKQANIDLAEALVVRNKELVKSGKGVQADVTTAELAVYQRQDDYLEAQAQRVERLNALLALIDSKPDFKRQTRFVPVRGFHTGSDLTNKEALVNFALQNRLDVSYYGSVVKSARLNLMRSENAAKPELNLVGGAGLYGLDEEVHRAFEQAGDNQGSEWSIGVEFKMNLGKEEGDARIRTAEHQLRQSELGLRKTKTSIALEVDTAHSRVISAKQRLKTAIKARELAEQNLQTEQELLDQGKGDLYRVIERQQILGDTKTNVVATQALLSKSVVALWMSSGQLFERFGVTGEWINAIVYEGAPASRQNENP
jgi:outer membrane protein TolC